MTFLVTTRPLGGAQEHRPLLFLLVTMLIAASFLTGCAGEKQSIISDTFLKGIESPHTAIDRAPLNPKYRYLKFQVNDQPALLVLGNINQKASSTTDVWYSAFKEVIELTDGRLGSTAGLDLNWTQVTLLDAPPLSDALQLDANPNRKRKPSIRFTRIRTVMPTYQVNVRETVVLEALANAPSDAPTFLKEATPTLGLRWVQETVLIPKNNKNPSIEPLRAIYALDQKTAQVVYGKQCLTMNYCLSWLQWPFPKVANSVSSKSAVGQ